MPSPRALPAHLIQFTVFGRKPAKARLPGLDTHGIQCGRYGPGKLAWRFHITGIYCN